MFMVGDGKEEVVVDKLKETVKKEEGLGRSRVSTRRRVSARRMVSPIRWSQSSNRRAPVR